MHGLLRRIFIFGFVLALAGAFFPARRYEASNPSFHQRDEMLLRDGRPFTGLFLERYQNGLPYRESAFRAGRKEGLSREFALNGTLIDQSWYQAGALEGLREGWFAEGPRRYEYHYLHGLLEGTQTEWHITGTIFRQQTFQGGREQTKKIFFSGGEIFTNVVRHAGRSFGLNGGALCMETPKVGQLNGAN